MAAKYTIGNTSVGILLSGIKANALSVPVMQRPFVWDSSKVRDLVDSLYRGFPIGYIILWGSPNVQMKIGRSNQGASAIIDGQQRITAIAAAIGGEEVVNKNYDKIQIRIAFNPFNETFAVLDAVIAKNDRYIQNISDVFAPGFNVLDAASRCYECEHGRQPSLAELSPLVGTITKLANIVYNPIGLVQLDTNLELDEVNQVFSRINSQGVKLSQYDFIMSRLASDSAYGGCMIQKTIDYFCHAIRKPEDWENIVNGDPAFASSGNAGMIKWVCKFAKSAHAPDDGDIMLAKSAYVPDYGDILQVAYVYKFHSGWISDLTKLLDGRDMVKKTYDPAIAQRSFQMLADGVAEAVKESNFDGYASLLKEMGIASPRIMRSGYLLNFGYALFLLLQERGYKNVNHIVSRWIAFSAITGRYSSYPGTHVNDDIMEFSADGSDPEAILSHRESVDLPNTFWNTALVERLETSAQNSPYLGIFLASLARTDTRCFLRNGKSVSQILTEDYDMHHIFPKNYLAKNGLNDKTRYNQIANMICMDTHDNETISDSPPCDYMAIVLDQCSGGKLQLGDITDRAALDANLEQNCIPKGFEGMGFSNYGDFLEKRRVLMASKIRDYYYSL